MRQKAVLAFALAGLCGAWPWPTAAQDLYIAGTVMNSETGAPVRQALVTLQPAAVTPPRDAAPQPAAVLTDAAGTFRISDVAPGRYAVVAAKPGFERVPNSAVAVGPSRDGVVLRLAPLARIAGKVTDADGRPMPGVAIRALLSRVQDGRRRIDLFRSASTDDLGLYRLTELPPGSYYILAAGRSGGTQLYVGQTGPQGSWHEGFVPTYYPRAVDRASASAVTLSPGREFEADFSLALQPAFAVRGSLRNLARYQPVQVELFRDGQAVAGRVAVNAATGRFEAHDLVPGDYLVRATQGEKATATRGEREVHIGAADVDGVVLDLAPGVEVTAAVRIAGPPKSDKERPPVCLLQLYPMHFEDSVGPYSGLDRDGKISIHGVPQGRYRVAAIAYGGYIASVVSGNQDLLHGAALTIVPGVAPEPIDVVFGTDGGTVTGSSATGSGTSWAVLAPVAGGTPLVAPVVDGRFRIGNVAPGDYTAYFVKDIGGLEYTNPDALRALGSGATVRVTGGETTAVTVQAVQ